MAHAWTLTMSSVSAMVAGIELSGMTYDTWYADFLLLSVCRGNDGEQCEHMSALLDVEWHSRFYGAVLQRHSPLWEQGHLCDLLLVVMLVTFVVPAPDDPGGMVLPSRYGASAGYRMCQRVGIIQVPVE